MIVTGGGDEVQCSVYFESLRSGRGCRYWNDPDASTKALLLGGWLRTGDLGALDTGGALWLLGRLKDVVRSGSENVHATTVERALLQIPGVAGAAVVGLPHDRLGEQVCCLHCSGAGPKCGLGSISHV